LLKRLLVHLKNSEDATLQKGRNSILGRQQYLLTNLYDGRPLLVEKLKLLKLIGMLPSIKKEIV
jgi:hypothetical protein